MRQRASYEPLTDALRRLIDAGIHTAVDDATVRRRSVIDGGAGAAEQ